MNKSEASKYDENNSLALTNDMFEGITFNGAGLTFEPKHVSFEGWKEAGIRLGQMNRISGFALGDWLNYGQAYIKPSLFTGTEPERKLFPDDQSHAEAMKAYLEETKKAASRYDEAIELTGLDKQTLINMASVAAKYQLKDRHIDRLTFTAHQEVAFVEPKLRAKLLQKAIDEKLTAKQLRALKPERTNKKQPSAQKMLIRKNIKLAKQMQESVSHLRKIKNMILLVEWWDVLYTLNDCFPDIWAKAQEAKAKKDAAEEAEREAHPY